MTKEVWQPMTVLIVDDDAAMRDSLVCLFESAHLPCKAFASANEFLESFGSDQQGCLLLDVRMPGMSGMELLEYLKAQDARLPVIVITGHGDVPLAVRAMKRGAFDFIQKPYNSQDLLDRVQAAFNWLLEHRLKDRKQHTLRSHFDALTKREKEILELVVAGDPSKVIGAKLGISSKTVDIHRSSIMKKLNVRNIAELIQRSLTAQAGK